MRKKQIKAKAKHQRTALKSARERAKWANGKNALDYVTFYGTVRISSLDPVDLGADAGSKSQHTDASKPVYPPVVPRAKDGNELVSGDHISMQMDSEFLGVQVPYWHHGLYLGGGEFGHMVIHYSGNAGPESTGKIEIVPIDKFGETYQIEVVPHPSPKYNREASIRRAMSRHKENAYSLLFNNCEHFVNWCIDGEHRSEQVDLAAGLTPITSSIYANVLRPQAIKMMREKFDS